MKKPLLILAALAATSAVLPTDANAGSSWKTFGAGNATGRGVYGNPDVSISSTTLKNPGALRFVVGGNASGRISISWYLTCFTGYRSRSADASGEYSLPRTFDLSNKAGGVETWERCDLTVSAYDFDPGSINVKLQARY